ncbi:MAG: ATPase, partial [Gammaproteobacteria bacterium]
PILSYSEDAERLVRWWEIQGHPRWSELRHRFISLLEEGQHLERMARILGVEALPPHQQLILLYAELINEGFLRQSAFSPVDRFASPRRQAAMMRILERFFEIARAAVEKGLSPQAIRAHPLFRRLSRLGEEIGEGEWERFDALEKALEGTF